MFVELYILCETFHTLPEAGALFDQDSYIMYGLLGAAKAFRERAQYNQHATDSQMREMMSRAGGR